jgi:hypothetical protein
MEKKLVCDPCREKSASLLSCIHTFSPRIKTSILSTNTRDEDIRAARELTEMMSHGA